MFDEGAEIDDNCFEADILDPSYLPKNNLQQNKRQLPINNAEPNKKVNDSGESNRDKLQKIKSIFQKRVYLNKNANKMVVERKFPGPAGLLPEISDFKVDVKTFQESKKNEKDVHYVVCSQLSVSAFYEQPWMQMCKDFEPITPDLYFLPDKYNIEWIKNNARANKLIDQKALFLAAVVESVDIPSDKVMTVTLFLKDLTGEIQATMLHELYAEYSEVLLPNSVIILKQFGVLSTEYFASECYLTITANNLITIYSSINEIPSSTQNVEGDSFSSLPDSSNQVISLQNIRPSQIIRNIEELKTKQLLYHNKQPNNASNVSAIDLPSQNNQLAYKNKIDFKKYKQMHQYNSNIQLNKSNLEANEKEPFLLRNLAADSQLNLNTHQIGANQTREATTHVPNIFHETNRTAESTKFNLYSNRSQLRKETKSAEALLFEKPDSNKDNFLNFDTVKDMCSSQISIKDCQADHKAILENVFDGVDAEDLFEEF